MSLTAIFLVALATAWVAVLVPAVIRARNNTPLWSSERFRRGLQVMAPPAYGGSGRWVITPRQEDRRVRRSYRDVGSDLALGLYVVALLEIKRRRVERVRKVSPLAGRRGVPTERRRGTAAAR